MKHIFISHSARDTRHLTIMRDNLLRIGYRPWIDPHPRPGQDWRFAIDDALLAADAVIVIVTRDLRMVAGTRRGQSGDSGGVQTGEDAPAPASPRTLRLSSVGERGAILGLFHP